MRWRDLSLAMLLVTAGCAAAPVRDVVGLIPVPVDENGPLVCKITSVLPHSPAQAAGLEVGDDIREIDGRRYTDAGAFLKALNDAPDELSLVIGHRGRERPVTVALAPKPPRLGVRCDIAGVQAVIEDEFVKNRYIVVENRAGVTLSANAELEGKLVLVRIGVQNFTDEGVDIDPAGISAADGAGVRLAAVAPAEATHFLGDRPGAVVKASEAEPLARQIVPPQAAATGSVYFAQPAAFPFVLDVDLADRRFEFHFESRKAP